MAKEGSPDPRKHADAGRRRQSAIYIAGVGGRRPVVPVAPARLAAAARNKLSPKAWAYLAGGAGQELAAAANESAFARWQIVPRVLRNVEKRDLSVTLFGQRLPSPLLLCPIGVLDLAHREADLAVARAAAALQVPSIFSNQASVPMERCAAAMGDAPRWFQLYWSRSNPLVASLVSRAEACGCSAIVLTLDTTMLGWRPRDLDLGSLPFLQGRGIAQYTSDPVFTEELGAGAADGGESGSTGDAAGPNAAKAPAEASTSESAATDVAAASPPLTFRTIATAFGQKARYPGGLVRNLLSGKPRAAVQKFLATYSRPSLVWDEIPFLRKHTKLPIVLKGILHPEDARTAVDRGVDGIIVSNHGGRQVDGAIATMDALPGIAEAVAGRIPVLLDSGVRSGADVVKALALGASAVCLGRPYAYGLALAGQRGVKEVVENVLAELDLTLGLAGCTSLKDLGPGALIRLPGLPQQ